MKSNKKVIFILGPTAVGKTKLSIAIAKNLNTEIISCDSRQFYNELKIGSAPPNNEDLKKIKHHFIHHLSIKDEYNAGKFEIDAIKMISKIHQNKNSVIVVGGSGLYVDSICKGFDKFPAISKTNREKAIDEYNKNGIDWLRKKIIEIEPEKYSNYDLNNPQRMLRVLEIYLETGKKMSSYKSNSPKKRSFKIIKIGLNMERSTLYSQIDKRVDLMIDKGLINEVESLVNFKDKNALQTVGYKEIFSFLNKEISLENAIENIKMNTRRFAKRQLTWFRKDKSIKWFKPSQIKEINKFILKS